MQTAPCAPTPNASAPGSRGPDPTLIRPQFWTETLVGLQPTQAWLSVAKQAGTAVGLAALYGAALGTRHGGLSLARHAFGCAGLLLAVGALGVPALAIVLALFDAPISPSQLTRSAARAAAVAGIVLVG